MAMKSKNKIEFFAIQNHMGQWYSMWVGNWRWAEDFHGAQIFTRRGCAEDQIERIVEDYPSQPSPNLIIFRCQEMEHVEFKPKVKNNKRAAVGKCKFCGVTGYKSDQGGIDGISEWEVYAAHKDSCPVKNKGHLQGEVTWVPLDEWKNFYSS